VSTGETPERTQLEPGDLVGRTIADRYALTRLVSTGANTSIFDALDDDTGRVVSLKLLRPSIASSPSFRDRFDDEMRSVSTLSHPNIVALYDWGIAAVGDVSTAFVVTETLAGGSLRDLFDRGRRLSPSQALTVGLDACRGLDHAHKRGFVHTELTPSKIVFGDDRRVRIADFGLARLLGAPAWHRPETVDNHVAWYAAPEQGAGDRVDGRTDVYALCLTLHEAVTGELPFKTDSTVATLAARVGRLMPVSADLGPLAAVFERAGRPDIDERATAAQFGKGLVQAASKLPRPEPLPLLSTGLFDTPADQMRSPNDPTGGVTRPAPGSPAVVVVPATPDVVTEDDVVEDAPGGPVEESADGVEAAPETDSDAVASVAPVVAAAAVAVGSPDEDPHATGIADLDDMPDPAEVPTRVSDDDLVILPVDSDLDGGPGAATDVATAAPAATMVDVRPLPATSEMPVAPSATAAVGASRRRRRFPWKIVLAVLVAAALIVLGVLASRLFETPEYEVPDLVEMPEAEARNLVAAYDWDVSVERERSDDVPTVGEVIRTVPAAGIQLAEGEPFLLVVSEGPVLRELPDSTGLTLAEAQTRLSDRDLDVDVVEAFHEDVPSGVVISWSVPGDPTLTTGSLVLPGTPVELVMSRGPEPRSVPNVVALPLSDARAQVEDLRLVLVEERHDFNDEVPLGYVISQTPAAGTEVERGSNVSVVVSRGPDLVTFPDLSAAATYEAAATILTEAGFVPNLVFGDAQGAITEILIDDAPAVPGTTYRRGTQVNISAI
jgi:serine/threonine-protein kinase